MVRETLWCIKTEPDCVVEDEAGIMEEVHLFFKDLYIHDETILRNGEERKQILNLITQRLPSSAAVMLEKTPT